MCSCENLLSPETGEWTLTLCLFDLKIRQSCIQHLWSFTRNASRLPDVSMFSCFVVEHNNCCTCRVNAFISRLHPIEDAVHHTNVIRQGLQRVIMTHTHRTQRDHRANVASVHSAVFCGLRYDCVLNGTSLLFLKRANSIRSESQAESSF